MYSLDLLGYDAMTLEVAGVMMTVPVLNKDRMMKALVFTKKNIDQTGKSTHSPYVANMLKLVKLRALYLAGGWAMDNVSELIVETCNDIVLYLGQEVVSGIAGVRQALALLDDDQITELAEAFGEGQKLEGTLGVRAVPTVYEAVRLAVGSDLADEMAVNLAMDSDTAEQIGHYMPEQKAIELSQSLKGNAIPAEIIKRMVDSQIEKLTLIDEGWTQLPGETKPIRLTGNWSDYIEEEEIKPSKPATSKKIPADVPTEDPFRKLGKKISEGKKGEKGKEKEAEPLTSELMKGLNSRINTLIALHPDKVLTVKRPTYYKDRPEQIRDPTTLAWTTYLKPFSVQYKLPIKDLIELFTGAGFTMKFV
jgi:hypothetical protein